jgi:hypothetical protein
MNHAVKIVKDDEGNDHIFNIAEWAETTVPVVDLVHGFRIVHDSEGKELNVKLAGWPENVNPEDFLSLKLHDIDQNPPKIMEEESTLMGHPGKDYFSQNDYFVDESSDGQFSSQTSHSSQRTRYSTRSSGQQEARKWICPICRALGTDAYFRHLDNTHAQDIAEAKSFAHSDMEQWKRSMSNEAYWNGM